MMFRSRFFSALVLVLTVVLSLAASAGVSRAEAPEWSGGFPKLVQKDVLLQWKPVKGATEYKVYKSEQKDKGLKLLASVKANRHIDKGIGSGKTFYYYIVPVVGGNEGERSSAGMISTAKEKVFIPLKTPRLAGGHVKDLPGGKYSIGIRWEDAGGTDFVGVNVYRSEKKGKDYAMIGSSSSDSFEDNDVKQGAIYYYVVTAVDSQFKETKYSNEIDVKMPSAAVKEGAKAAAEEKVLPTKMRRAKLLYTIPADTRDKIEPGNAQDVVADEATQHVYVSSYVYGGVLVYNFKGELQFGIRKDGVSGSEMFSAPVGVALGRNGELYVAEYGGKEVKVFDMTGKPIDSIKVDLSYMKGGMANIYGVKVDSEGRIYLSDPNAKRVHVLDQNKKRIFDLAPPAKDEEKQFNGPSFITFAKNGDILIVDSGNVRIQVYGRDGKYKRTFGKMGMGAGLLWYPMGLATGSEGEIFASSGMTPNIQALDENGNFLYALCNEKGNGPLDVGFIHGIYVDSKNRLYVAEGLFNKVSVFQLLDGFIEVMPEK